jgi:hypothetical protein
MEPRVAQVFTITPSEILMCNLEGILVNKYNSQPTNEHVYLIALDGQLCRNPCYFPGGIPIPTACVQQSAASLLLAASGVGRLFVQQ